MFEREVLYTLVMLCLGKELVYRFALVNIYIYINQNTATFYSTSYVSDQIFFMKENVLHKIRMHKRVPCVFVIQPGKALHWRELDFQKNVFNLFIKILITPQKTIKSDDYSAVKTPQYEIFV